LGRKFTVDTLFALRAEIQWISFPLWTHGSEWLGKKANPAPLKAGAQSRAFWRQGVECAEQAIRGEACNAPALDRGSDDDRDDQSCSLAGGHRRTSGSTMHFFSPFNARLEAGRSAMGLHLPKRSHLQFSVLRHRGTERGIGGINLYFESGFAEPRICCFCQDEGRNHILLYGKSDRVQLERPKYDITM
jgi:hypothetical protein